MIDGTPILETTRLCKRYKSAKLDVQALIDVNIHVNEGETVGILGESGSGKTTLGKAVLRLIDPSDGKVRFAGVDLSELSCRDLKNLRRNMQMVFQDPYSSLNPKMRVEEIIGEGLAIHRLCNGVERHRRIGETLQLVGLPAKLLDCFPNMLSGGQRQRVSLARALALKPGLIVLDEPVSSLDIVTQIQILSLLKSLQENNGLAYLFISHDLRAIQFLAKRVYVLYMGRVVEAGPVDEVFINPRHPYTQALVSAVPVPDPRMEKTKSRILLKEESSSCFTPSKGCPFHARCPKMKALCKETYPAVTEKYESHWAACHFSSSYPSRQQ